MAVGKVSFDDWDMLTSSLGWIGTLDPITPPAISMARLEITSLAFMLLWVPLPVCQTLNGNWSSSFPSETSRAAAMISADLSGGILPRSALTWADASFKIPMARMSGSGIRSSPIGKWCSERAVWAPQYRSAGTSIVPMLSDSMRVSMVMVGSFRFRSPRSLDGAGRPYRDPARRIVHVRCFSAPAGARDQERRARPRSHTARALARSSARGPSPTPGTSRMAASALEGGMTQKSGQPLLSDGSLADVLVAVPVGPELHLRVVEVQAAQPFEPDRTVHQLHQGVSVLGGRERDPRCPQVLGIETDSQPIVAVRRLDDLGQLLEGAANRVARSGGVLEQDGARRRRGFRRVGGRGFRSGFCPGLGRGFGRVWSGLGRLVRGVFFAVVPSPG